MPEYETAKAFAQALSTRLQQHSKEEGIDLNYLRRIVAIDVFLARLQRNNVSFFLKGGYAMELRMSINRTTKDVDISYSSIKLSKMPEDQQQHELLNLFRNACAEGSQDFFVFKVEESAQSIDKACGGARFPIRVFLDNRVFTSFGLDVIIGDNELEPTEKLKSNNLLAFANIPQVEYRAISAAQQFAEKLHAYTNPTWEENSRVKDLVDMVLLINDGKLNRASLGAAIETIFKRRKTHELPTQLSPPPESWKKPYITLANQCKIESNYLAAYQQVKQFVETIFSAPASSIKSTKLIKPEMAVAKEKLVSLAKVVHLKDDGGHEVIINKGSVDGIVEGQKFLVYGLGMNIRDPETNEDLGILEMPRGEGVITYVQDKMSHLRCITSSEPRRKTRHINRGSSIYAAFINPEIEEEVITDALPFDGAVVGDIAKRIIK